MINLNTNFNKENDIKTFLEKEKFENIFIITGKNSYYKSGASKIFDNLLSNKKTKFYFKKESVPEFEELKKIINIIRENKPNLIIAIGGGAVIDYAKIANILSIQNVNEKIIMENKYDNKKKFATLVAIPTTAGSGAEVTSNAVIYINKTKYSVEGFSVKPDYFFLVPELVMNSPVKLKASAGFDAISQAIESMISTKSTEESFNYAKISLDLSLKNYITFLKNNDQNNSSAMCLAAHYSGKAISISKTTAPHAVSYPFTSYFGVSHGHAVSLTLDKFLKFNYQNISNSHCNFDLSDRFENIFKIAKVKTINELSQLLNSLKIKAGLEQSYKKLNIDIENSFSKIISGVNLQRLKNNPVPITEKDIKKIILSN